MREYRVDLAVIGSGPAGQKAAIQAAKLGKSVVVIERSSDPGGTCLYSGTIPSKTLREAILDLTGFLQRSFYAKWAPLREVSISDLNHRVYMVMREEGKLIARQFKKNGIELISGIARFENEHTLIVIDDHYRIKAQVTAEYFVIATGSNPRNPPDVPFDKEVILDSTSLLSIDRVPKTMIVLGGGIIGSEYASFFSALGVEVTVVDKKDHLLPMLDREIGIHLQTALTEIGLKFRGNTSPVKIERLGDQAMVEFSDGSCLKADCLLYALGRTANVADLHIENAGVTQTKNNYIAVNSLFQTVRPHIYAVGDVIGGPCLASTSMEQGRIAARHAFSAQTHRFPSFYPVGIYTIPEISCCGQTEDELKLLGFRYEVGRAYYYEVARSHISGSNVGMFKILFHAETLEILGIHVLGRGAAEVIHIGQVAVSFNAKLDYFVDHVFNYPTFAEGYRIAALNGLNKIRSRP